MVEGSDVQMIMSTKSICNAPASGSRQLRLAGMAISARLNP